MVQKVNLSPPPSMVPSDIPSPFLIWFQQIFDRLGSGPLKVQGYIKASLPVASEWGNSTSGTSYSSIIYVNDATAGSVLCFSDGTDWRRVDDSTIIT